MKSEHLLEMHLYGQILLFQFDTGRGIFSEPWKTSRLCHRTRDANRTWPGPRKEHVRSRLMVQRPGQLTSQMTGRRPSAPSTDSLPPHRQRTGSHSLKQTASFTYSEYVNISSFKRVAGLLLLPLWHQNCLVRGIHPLSERVNWRKTMCWVTTSRFKHLNSSEKSVWHVAELGFSSWTPQTCSYVACSYMCVCVNVCTRVALIRVSVHDNVRYRRHDLLDQAICQHGHSLMIVLLTQHINTGGQNQPPSCWPSKGLIVGFTSISCWAMLQAAPRPTASGVGTVPERSPRSCPPPLCSGSRRTRGRRRTYRAPTPAHTCTGGPVRRSGPGRRVRKISSFEAKAHLWAHRFCDRLSTSDQLSSPTHWWESFQPPVQHQCVRKLP